MPSLSFASLCYFVQNFGNILFPRYVETFATIGLLSIVEVALPLWLVIKGVNIESWQERVYKSATGQNILN